MIWILHNQTIHCDLGFIPSFLHDSDPRPAAQQFEERYSHGGGWRPLPGFHMAPNHNLHYPGDPPNRPVAETTLHPLTDRPEQVIVYEHAWVAIVQPDGSYEISRMD